MLSVPSAKVSVMRKIADGNKHHQVYGEDRHVSRRNPTKMHEAYLGTYCA